MKKAFIIFSLATFVIACGTKSKKTNTPENSSEEITTTETVEGEKMLLGIHTREELEAEPYNEWFKSTYEAYAPDQEVISKLKPLVENLEIKIFMGTWCSDSQREVPSFFKVMDQAGYDYKNFTLIAMDEDKTTPDNFEKGLDITNVPTIIFYKNKEERNRIVEYTIETIEKDILNILQENTYKNAYAE